MAYKKITVPSVSTDSTQVTGIPSNNDFNFDKSSKGISESIVDYQPTIDSSGDFKQSIGIKTIIASLRNLLLTPRGTYPFDPEFGSDLYKQVFEPADNFTKERIYTEVVERIKQYDDRVMIEDVQTSFYSNKKGFKITVFLKRRNNIQTLNLDFTEQTGFSIEE